ncbi:MAG: type II toxin-antitoxin system VapC family toxin [Rhodospirillales bacterium]|nr:type II toxin-antitoxin system VapC family toxin [Rhodospirillales bacterium]
MIAVDTSALMAILLDEEAAEVCAATLRTNERIVISAGTVAEALIVAERRALGSEMAALIDGLGLEVENVTLAAARRIAESYARWGKGVNPAGLNFGDCFAYEVATTRECPLLYVGADFAQTDVSGAL